MPHALTRLPSPSIAEGPPDFTPGIRGLPSYTAATTEHASFRSGLTWLGYTVRTLPNEPDHPEGCFVGDQAVMLGIEIVWVRPPGVGRRAEQDVVWNQLNPLLPSVDLSEGGILDGRDVVVSGREVWLGRGGRSSAEGIQAFGALARGRGWRVIEVDLPRGYPNLQALLSAPIHGLLITPEGWKVPDTHLEALLVPRAERAAVAAIGRGRKLLLPPNCPRTRAALERRGLTTQEQPVAELSRLDASLAALSLRWGG